MPISTRLINRTHVRDKALAVLAAERPHLAPKLTRVSGEFFARAEACLTNFIVAQVRSAPSVGKTLK